MQWMSYNKVQFHMHVVNREWSADETFLSVETLLSSELLRTALLYAENCVRGTSTIKKMWFMTGKNRLSYPPGELGSCVELLLQEI